MPPPQKDSVHRYFNYNQANNYSKCNLCKRSIKGKHTSNLKSHLATKHTVEFQIVAELNKNSSNSTKTSKKISSTKTNNQISSSETLNLPEIWKTPLIEKIKKICVRLVTEHGRQINMIEDKAFQELLRLACSESKDVSLIKDIHTKSIKNAVHEQADFIRKNIWCEVKNKLVTLKVDSVTCFERKFLSLNIQYVKNGKLVVRNLAVQEIQEPPTGPFLKSALQEVLSDFGIGVDNIYCICTDNGANMVKPMRKYLFIENKGENGEEGSDEDESDQDECEDCTILGHRHGKMEQETINSTGDEEERPCNDFSSTEQDFDVQDLVSVADVKIRAMLCAAHALQLAINNAIADNAGVVSLLNAARRIVHILKRPNITRALKSANQRKAILDCSTSWASTYNMLKRLLTLREFIDIRTTPEVSLLVSPAFWTELTDIVECLKPAIEAAEKLHRRDLTIGDFYIVWANCKILLSAIDHDFAACLTRSMQVCENKLLNNDVVLEALYVDCRLNILLNEQQCEKAKSLLKETRQKLLKLNRTAGSVDVEANSEINKQSTNALAVSSTNEEMSALETILMSAERARGLSRQRRSFDTCLNELVLGPRLTMNESILNHWNNVAALNSDLASVANTVLAAPATQASVERLFSSVKFILNPLRSDLSQRLLRDMILIRQNKDLLD